MYIVLLGAPGTGKGTQAQFISNAYNLPIVSAGHILRNISKKKTHFGQEIFKIIKQGKLVPNETITNIIQKEILKKKLSNWVYFRWISENSYTSRKSKKYWI